MKKNLLYIAAIATAFVGCSNNDFVEEVVDQEVAIGFASNDVSNITRADITLDWMKTTGEGKFGVYSDKTAPTAFTVFTNEKVDYTSDWVHSTVRYWDKGASAKYNFYAYSPYMTTGVAYNAGQFTFSGLTPFKEIGEGVDDICVADPKLNWTYAATHDGNLTGSSAADGHVTFDFHHVLSKLVFKYLTDETGVTIKVKNVEIGVPTATSASWAQTANTAIAGTTTFTGYTAIAADTYGTTQYSNTTGQALGSTAAELTGGKQYIVVPNGTGATAHAINIKVTYDITYADSTTESDCVATGVIKTGTPATDIAFQQGYLYTVNVKVGPAKIEFDVNSVKDWTAAGDTNVTVQ